MGQNLHLILLVPGLVTILPFIFDNDPVCKAMEVMPYNDVLKVFGAIANPFDTKKIARNNFTDVATNELLDIIEAAMLASDETVNRAAKSLKITPFLEEHTIKPLQHAEDELDNTRETLQYFLETCQNLRVVAPSLSSEEHENHAGHEIEDFGVSEKIAVPNVLEILESHTSKAHDLAEPVRMENSFNAILAKYGKDKHLTLEDAAKALKALAEMIEEDHRRRFIKLGPMIKMAKQELLSILEASYKAQVTMKQHQLETVKFASDSARLVRHVHDEVDTVKSGVDSLSC